MQVKGIVAGCIVEYLDRGMQRKAEVLAKINERIPKLVLVRSNGIVIEREDRCSLHSVRVGSCYYGLDGDLLD